LAGELRQEEIMDGSQFDRWTRRSVGLAMGGAAVVLLGMGEPREVDARKKHKNHGRKGHKHPEEICHGAMQSCQSSGTKGRCCDGLRCESNGLTPETRCCAPVRAACASALECCGLLGCQGMSFVPGTYCCKLERDACIGEGSDSDCCGGLYCQNQSCIVPMP
jgi:hypothetical protein